jgi:hypothetical protein
MQLALRNFRNVTVRVVNARKFDCSSCSWILRKIISGHRGNLLVGGIVGYLIKDVHMQSPNF